MKFIFFVLAVLITNITYAEEIDDTYAGTTDLYFRYFGTDDFLQNVYYENKDQSNLKQACIGNNGNFDIRLDKVYFDQDFDSGTENFFEGGFWNTGKSNTNELAIFLSISEREELNNNIQQQVSKTDYYLPNNRLIYLSTPRKKYNPINSLNKRLYSGINNGKDIKIKIEVRELDSPNKDTIAFLELLSEESDKYPFLSNVNNVLNKFGTTVKSTMFKDDLITTFEVELVSCDKYNNNQVYLQEGQLLFLRLSQAQNGKRFTDLSWDKNRRLPKTCNNKACDENKNQKLTAGSFISLRVHKRNQTSVTSTIKKPTQPVQPETTNIMNFINSPRDEGR